jgi:mRNA interferase RelE/StbE
MAYTVELRPSAEKQLDKLPAQLRERIIRRLEELEIQPRPREARKVAGREDFYRVRVGDYRIVYELHDRILLVLVIRIGHRREVYRGL